MLTNKFFLDKATTLAEAVDLLQNARLKTDPWIQEKIDAEINGDVIGGKHSENLLSNVLEILDIVQGTLIENRDKAITICQQKIDKLEELRERRDQKHKKYIERMGIEAYEVWQEERRAQRNKQSRGQLKYLTYAQAIGQLEQAIIDMKSLCLAVI